MTDVLTVDVWAVVVAAGSGNRYSSQRLKQHQLLLGKTVLERSVTVLLQLPEVKGVMVVMAEDDHARLSTDSRIHYCTGGEQRHLSVLNGLHALQALAQPTDLILVHDAARPCVRADDIQKLISQWIALGAADQLAVCLGAPCVDNLQQVDASLQVVATPDRQQLWRAFTPQAANLRSLLAALTTEFSVKDEAEAIVRHGGQVQMVQGATDNIKITYEDDLSQAQFILQQRYPVAAQMKIGQGYDVHAFKPGDHIVLGGVTIAHDQAIAAHSDGDVLLHAICDAVLGALGMGDIGVHFPDTDPAFANADSRLLLAKVIGWMCERGWQLQNLDATVIAQRPKLRPYIAQMQMNLAEDFAVAVDRINIKATTTERLGFIGREEGLAAEAVVMLIRA